jgi:DGQHR domain-containing protein
MTDETPSTSVPAIRVRQWLPEWEDVDFTDPHKRRPPNHFFVFSMPASSLRALCGVERRKADTRRSSDVRIQRSHDQERSDEIARFVKHGFPWSALAKARRNSGKFDDIKQPGWLPTSIVVNIRTAEQSMGDRKVAAGDLVSVSERDDGSATIELPLNGDDAAWSPKDLEPMEVIDGQHRLFAFEAGKEETDFELPVVAFVGLARSWQAYLFWTINIKPKRINASLAYDLYPLLRNQDWLERFEGPTVYRETRAQELTEMLWAHAESPWHRRINMLGDRGDRHVRQAAWVRSLTSTYIKASEGRGVRGIGGLFGAPAGDDELTLPWTREQQAAFLIYAWQQLAAAVKASDDDWATNLRDLAAKSNEAEDEAKAKRQAEGPDPAFAGRYTLLNADQGVRGVLFMTNDLCFLGADALKLQDWGTVEVRQGSDEKEVSAQLKHVAKEPVAKLLAEIANGLASFDWRTYGTPGLDEDARLRAAAYRGSSGYVELRRQLLAHLERTGTKRVKRLAAGARTELKLD